MLSSWINILPRVFRQNSFVKINKRFWTEKNTIKMSIKKKFPLLIHSSLFQMINLLKMWRFDRIAITRLCASFPVQKFLYCTINIYIISMYIYIFIKYIYYIYVYIYIYSLNIYFYINILERFPTQIIHRPDWKKKTAIRRTAVREI